MLYEVITNRLVAARMLDPHVLGEIGAVEEPNRVEDRGEGIGGTVAKPQFLVLYLRTPEGIRGRVGIYRGPQLASQAAVPGVGYR